MCPFLKRGTVWPLIPISKHVCLNMCTYIWMMSCLCVSVASQYFPHGHLSFHMLYSPLYSVPVLHHGLSLNSRWLQRGACDTAYHLVILYLTSFLCLIFWNLHQAEGKKCTNKNNIIKVRNSFISIWAVRLRTSHLFRGRKLIQFAMFASRLIQQPLSKL